jgi:hypothetical protein
MYLPEFREDFNQRFAVAPRSTHDAHRPLLKTDLLDVILTHQETRSLSKNLTVQYQHVVYQVVESPLYKVKMSPLKGTTKWTNY